MAAEVRVGDKFGRWTVERLVGVTRAFTRCECGGQGLVYLGVLTNGSSKQCSRCSHNANTARRRRRVRVKSEAAE